MNMKVTYELTMNEDAVTVISARCELPLYGRWTELVVTSYALHEHDYCTMTAVNFGFRPIPNSEVRGSSFAACQNGLLGLSRGTGANRQQFEQALSVPKIVGVLLDYSDLNDGGVPAGRTVTGSILRRIESLVETARQKIRDGLAIDPEVRTMALNKLHDHYGEATAEAINTFLGQIDWRLMLAKSGCDDDQLNVVEFAMGHNPPRFLTIHDEPSLDIPLIASAPLNRFDRATIANIKATALLRNVCGEKLFNEFESTGQITVEEQGFKFEIKPGEFVKTTDPNGKTARLCIHTIGFACNPIDEVVIAFLHIKHKLAAYLKEAIVHGPQPGFSTKLKDAA
jgi:hypothetical protein